jgi:TrmH family RNA methyltransferase
MKSSTPLFLPASKALLKQARKLHQSGERKESGRFIAEGIKVVKELLASRLETVAVLGFEEELEELHELYPQGFYHTVNSKDLDYISGLKTPNKVAAVAVQPSPVPFTDLISESCLLLDHISDPGNMGTIIRTAEWFGVRNIICSFDSADCWSPKVVQSSMGSLFRSHLVYADLKEVVNSILLKGTLRLLGASLDGSKLTSDKSLPFALVIGSESHGISSELLEMLPEKVKIPGSPDAKTESLNAAVACGIILHSLAKK